VGRKLRSRPAVRKTTAGLQIPRSARDDNRNGRGAKAKAKEPARCRRYKGESERRRPREIRAGCKLRAVGQRYERRPQDCRSLAPLGMTIVTGGGQRRKQKSRPREIRAGRELRAGGRRYKGKSERRRPREIRAGCKLRAVGQRYERRPRDCRSLAPLGMTIVAAACKRRKQKSRPREIRAGRKLRAGCRRYKGESERRRPREIRAGRRLRARATSAISREYFGRRPCIDKRRRTEALELMAAGLRGVRWEISSRIISIRTGWTGADS